MKISVLNCNKYFGAVCKRDTSSPPKPQSVVIALRLLSKQRIRPCWLRYSEPWFQHKEKQVETVIRISTQMDSFDGAIMC